MDKAALLGAAVLGFSLLLATLVEGAMEVLVGKAVGIWLRDYPKDDVVCEWASYGLQVMSILVGIGLIFTTNLDIVGFAADQFSFEIEPIVSKCLTGFIVGRGASYVHDIWKRVEGS